MKKLFILLMLFASTAFAELRPFPDEGMLAGGCVSDTPGKWVVFGEGFLPVQPTVSDDTKIIWWQGPAGTYGVVFFPAGEDTQPFITRVIVGPAKPAKNNPPTIISAPVITAKEGEPYTYGVKAVDPDADDTLVYALPTAPVGMSIDPVTGVVNWMPNTTQVGPNAVTVSVRDSLLADTQSFVIEVDGTPSSGKYDIMMFYAKEQLRDMPKERNAVLNGLKLRSELEADGHTIVEVLEDDVFTEGLAAEWEPFAEAVKGETLPIVVLRDKETKAITFFPLPGSPEEMKELLK